MPDSILIERRYCGPPDSGNGGYVSGRLAAHVEGPALVRLQVPPPLGVAMAVRKAGECCIAIGWEIGREGRKHHTGTALYSESGRCVGIARATWFEISPKA